MHASIVRVMCAQVAHLPGWDKRRNNIVFHIFDDPGHGRDFHYFAEPGAPLNAPDSYLDEPPSGRLPPAEEIQHAFSMLMKNHVIRYAGGGGRCMLDPPVHRRCWAEGHCNGSA